MLVCKSSLRSLFSHARARTNAGLDRYVAIHPLLATSRCAVVRRAPWAGCPALLAGLRSLRKHYAP